MNVSVVRKENCCGCTACYSVCPRDAITMQVDEQGFLYPFVSNKCIDCGICLSACDQAKKIKNQPIGSFAAKSAYEAVLRNSSSGGVSHALCKQIMETGGVAYGTIFDDLHNVIMYRAKDIGGCDGFYGSKYVQTNQGETFRHVAEDLKNKTPVLFVGTSCHVAGLISFLGKLKCNTEKLVTADFACHGTPSPLLFKNYIDFLRENNKFSHFKFRTKELKWGNGSSNYGCTIFYKDGKKETNTPKANLFLNLFFANTCLRPSCYSCAFSSKEKPADITIADFWGCKESFPEFFDPMGVSAIIVRTQKGIKYLQGADELILQKTSYEQIENNQLNFKQATKISNSYEDFWNLYAQEGFMAVAKRYGNYSEINQFKIIIKNMILRINKHFGTVKEYEQTK